MSSLRRIVPILAFAAAGLALAGCGGSGSSVEETTTSATTTLARTTAPKTTTTRAKGPIDSADIRPLDPNKTYTVEFQTTEGSFTVTLDQKTSPHVAASFAHLVGKKWFDKTFFHRIIPGFLFQGGDKSGTGHGFPGYTVRDTPPANTKYTTGVVAMAKTGVQPSGTAGSQFFVVIKKSLDLPPDYAVLGRVTGGMKVVRKISTLGDVATELPTKRVVVRRAILHVG